MTEVDKAPYEQLAEVERRKYEEAMRQYNMVRPASRDTFFSSRPALLLCVAGEHWKRLTEVEKIPYEQLAEVERVKYKERMQEYNAVRAFFLATKQERQRKKVCDRERGVF